MLNDEESQIGHTQTRQVHIYSNLTSKETWSNPGVAHDPVINPEQGVKEGPINVEISSLTDGASIYYTIDGSNPTESSTLYENPFEIDQNCTIKAISIHPELYPSQIATAEYQIVSEEPIFSLEESVSNNTRTLELSTTKESKIRYTTDGTTPTEQSTLYTGPITVDKNMSIKAISIEENKSWSDIVSKAYEIVVSIPEFSLESGEYNEVKSLSISSATTNAEIRYTLDGTDPTDKSTLYKGPIPLSKNTTIKAIAFREGCTPSTISAADYTITLNGTGGLVVHNPVNYELIVTPSLSLDNKIPHNSKLQLTANFNPSNESATYIWYLDSEQIGTGNVLSFDDNTLTIGAHEISIKAIVNGRAYDWHHNIS